MFKHVKTRIKKQVRSRRLKRRNVLDPVDLNALLLGGEEGWVVCPEAIDQASVVYSFGVGRNADWDLAMIERFGVTVHAFDPTPESIRWAGEQQLPHEFRFHDYGISNFDGVSQFYPPKRPGGHYSEEQRKHTKPEDETVPGQVHRLSTIMRQKKHERVDVLKLDVEGSEFEAIPDILQEGMPIGQLLVEIHYHYPSRSFSDGMKLIESIKRSGMCCYHVSDRGYEFAFINRDLLAVR